MSDIEVLKSIREDYDPDYPKYKALTEAIELMQKEERMIELIESMREEMSSLKEYSTMGDEGYRTHRELLNVADEHLTKLRSIAGE